MSVKRMHLHNLPASGYEIKTATTKSEELDAKISKLGDEIAELFAGSTASHFDYITRHAL